MTVLFDANVLIALLVADHVHHRAAEDWFVASSDMFATCPVTEGGLVRVLVRGGQSADAARQVLDRVSADERHEFWPDDLSYRQVRMQGVIGHRQVTDAYLAQLARAHDARLATFDQGLAKLHDDVCDLVPVLGA